MPFSEPATSYLTVTSCSTFSLKTIIAIEFDFLSTEPKAPVHTRNLKTAGFYSEKASNVFPSTPRPDHLGKSQVVTSSFSISSHFEMFSVYTKTQSWCFQFPRSCSKSAFEKLRFRDGLVWTVGLTLEKSCVFKFLPCGVDNRDFKIHYGGLLLRLLRPRGTRLTTLLPPQTSNRLRFRLYGDGVFSVYVPLKKWIRSTSFYVHTTKPLSMTVISFSRVNLTSPKT